MDVKSHSNGDYLKWYPNYLQFNDLESPNNIIISVVMMIKINIQIKFGLGIDTKYIYILYINLITT